MSGSLVAERALIDHQEQVAALRRSLPPGPVLKDYSFVEGQAPLDDGDTPSPVRLHELFGAPDRPLLVYHLMFGKAQAAPCPMCTMWIDGFDNVARHVRQHADVVVVAAAELGALRAHARDRGWDDLRLVSADTSSFKADLGSEEPDGTQRSMLSVLTKDADGSVRLSVLGDAPCGRGAWRAGDRRGVRDVGSARPAPTRPGRVVRVALLLNVATSYSPPLVTDAASPAHLVDATPRCGVVRAMRIVRPHTPLP